MTLPTRPLGSSGLGISTVGFGAWAAGRGWFDGQGPQGDATCIAAMRHALDLGVNWIDTAAVYSLGHSEDVVSRLLRQLPEDGRPYIFTTCGEMSHSSAGITEPRCRLTPDSIREDCEASLLRLGISQIDLYQYHWPDDTDIAVEDLWEAMRKLVENGKVRAVGVSNFPVELLERCEAIGHVDSLQPPFSLMNHAAAANEISWCDHHRTGVLCWLPSGDWRTESARSRALEGALRLIARRHDTTIACVAIAWTLAWPGVTAAIVGSRSPEQVDGWIGAATLQLTPTDLAELGSAIDGPIAGKVLSDLEHEKSG